MVFDLKKVLAEHPKRRGAHGSGKSGSLQRTIRIRGFNGLVNFTISYDLIVAAGMEDVKFTNVIPGEGTDAGRLSIQATPEHEGYSWHCRSKAQRETSKTPVSRRLTVDVLQCGLPPHFSPINIHDVEVRLMSKSLVFDMPSTQQLAAAVMDGRHDKVKERQNRT